MTIGSSHCSDEHFLLLLDGDETSLEFRTAAEHVEHCPTCQQRLTELSGDHDFWQTQRQLLSPVEDDQTNTGELYRYHSIETNVAERRGAVETLVRDMLQSPSHPETLGRLGRYEVERIIGVGGMGIVLKGFDTELHRPVAIKLLAPHLSRIGAARQRFAREARAAAAVVHEHVVPIHNVESNVDHPYLVMQYIAGQSLQARVDESGPLSVSEILRIGMQAASGLAAAHAQGLVHRDVKPANILLENDVDRAYLTDFGLARAADDASLTYTGVVSGTPHYMSPEQADGRPLDHRSDLFSLGSVLYFMATGHPPFRAERPMAVLKRTCHDPHRPAMQANAEIPEELSETIDRLLEKQPDRRFATAADLQKKLERMLADLQQGKLRLRHAPLVRPWILGSAAITALALFVLMGITFYITAGVTRRPADPGRRYPIVNDSVESIQARLQALEGPSQVELDSLRFQLNSLEEIPFPETDLQERNDAQN
ncbi:serine/threonine protein kinase [Blastopirellula sp. JC732]|uniref:non-specific serine/threonine protein kinase n=1 Tax=Blastopirellula sediminis TaxID=2894196 RepID=A0A9X1MN75_9BACT|nr:serine/threonine-protein kinase [Blastopirellula sediminis]MCC9606951.1 serine/threonine protein kinase [Blastopirellula sediminis]MCC9629754.1 serine/threonine protein kinase [Blastopirellula sediminis]